MIEKTLKGNPVGGVPIMPYEEAKRLVRAKHIWRLSDYKMLHKQRKLPKGLPANPYTAWRGKFRERDFFFPKRKMNREELQAFVNEKRVSSLSEYERITNCKKNTPLIFTDTEAVFLPSPTTAPELFADIRWSSKYPPYDVVKRIVAENRILNRDRYYKFAREYTKLKLPAKLATIYKEDWRGWREFLKKPIDKKT